MSTESPVITWDDLPRIPEVTSAWPRVAGQLYKQSLPGGSWRVWEYNDKFDMTEVRVLTPPIATRMDGTTIHAKPIAPDIIDGKARPAVLVHDVINKAAHYNAGKFEVIEVLLDWGLETDALLWNTVKYIARSAHKGNQLQDLKKARYYLDRRIKALESAAPTKD